MSGLHKTNRFSSKLLQMYFKSYLDKHCFMSKTLDRKKQDFINDDVQFNVYAFFY